MDSPVVYYMGERWRVTKPLHTYRPHPSAEPVQRIVLTSIDGAKVSVHPASVVPVNQVRNQA